MDVMSPDLLWIGDRCYRLPVLNSSTSESIHCLEEADWVETETSCDYEEKILEDEDNEDSNIMELIEELPNGRYKLSLSIPQTFWSKIIGTKGVTKKRIESNTNTTIIIPRPTEHGEVIIKATSIRNIVLAKKSIDDVVFSSRQKLVFTHFVSIPLNCEEIKKNFIIFKDKVLKLHGKDRGVHESIFQNPDKLHLTIGTLVLTDQNERKLAEKLLKEVFEKSIRPIIGNLNNIKIEMKGIEYMNDDPAEVDVLYAKLFSKEKEDIIQKVADSIFHYFSDHKLIKSEDKKNVKLHVTLMNTLFREEELDELDVEADSMNRNKWNRKARRTFNAINILQNFQNFYFGEQELKCLQLSVRFTTDTNGYYKSSCIINF